MRVFAAVFLCAIFCLSGLTASYAEEKVYVGSDTCRECHEKEYERFSRHAKKARSFESIKVMKSKLTEKEYRSCFECHTTGYGKPGGFVSEEKTPALKNAGCEVCHGPGSLHVDYGGDPADIKRDLSVEGCTRCHNKERVDAFNFKPLLFGGAH